MSAALHPHPFAALVKRYCDVFRAAWAHRAELAGPSRLADEAAFLPPALSLQDTPVHPAPRRFAFALIAISAAALLWSVFGEVDIVAVAPGHIVVSERTKLVQPLERSVVRRILVTEGQKVAQGQPLIELDPTAADADSASMDERFRSATQDAIRARALLGSWAGVGEAKRPDFPRDWSEADRRSTASQIEAEGRDIAAKQAKLASSIELRQAEAATARASIAKIEATLPMARRREQDAAGLAQDGYLPAHNAQDRTRERVEMERDLATQKARLAEAEAATAEARNALAAFLAETRRALSDRLAEAESKAASATQELAKTHQRQALTVLRAPAAGTVQQLAVHTAGGVVTEAQVLAVIVPQDAQVTAEVVIDNKDIGFVRAGQHAEIKLETFPYTRYGTVAATVVNVAADAVNDEKKGLLFPAALALNASGIDVDGKRVRLSPGMNVTAEIKTGRRRVIEFVLSPVLKAGSEGMRER